MKKTWKSWAVTHIKEHNQCPGETPAFGTPQDLLTHDEFLSSINSSGTHKYDGCHFLEDMIAQIPDTMKQVKKVDDIKLPPQEMEVLQADLDDVKRSQKLADIKQKLHSYVDRIYFKDGKVLSVPDHLLNLKQYLAQNL